MGEGSLLHSFLEGRQSSASSDQILGILEQMREDFKANLAEATQKEQQEISAFEELTAARQKQIAAATKGVREKGGRLAMQKQQVADEKEEREDTSKALASDEDFIIKLKAT